MNDEKEKKKISFTNINIPYPKSCSECKLFDDRWDYPTCYATQKSTGYNFNIFKNRMSDCPLNKITIEYE